MEKIKDFLTKEFLRGYSLFDKLFMVAMLLLQIVVFYIVPDSIIGIIAGISGVISVVLCAKGKISFYFIGFVQTITYLILSWQNCFYGEVLENVFYLVTMVWGIFVWKNHSKVDDTGSAHVEALKFTPTMWVYSIVGTLFCSFILGYILNKIGNNQPYTDALTNVLAIFAQILMVKRYREQWFFWLLIDILCIKLWLVAGNYSMVAMYIAWSINCIYGCYNWSKLIDISNKKQRS
jgi:nicotinamide mononucleotide transporter